MTKQKYRIAKLHGEWRVFFPVDDTEPYHVPFDAWRDALWFVIEGWKRRKRIETEVGHEAQS